MKWDENRKLGVLFGNMRYDFLFKIIIVISFKKIAVFNESSNSMRSYTGSSILGFGGRHAKGQRERELK
jgi:hypothetical protein